MAVASPQATKRRRSELRAVLGDVVSGGAHDHPWRFAGHEQEEDRRFCPPAHPWFTGDDNQSVGRRPCCTVFSDRRSGGRHDGPHREDVVAARPNRPAAEQWVRLPSDCWTLSGSRMAPQATNPSDSMTTAAAATSVHDRRDRRERRSASGECTSDHGRRRQIRPRPLRRVSFSA